MLKSQGLTICYQRGVPVVQGISFEVKEGSCTAFIGPNGSGKSTTIKSICGLVAPSAGEIWFNGERIDSLPIHEIAKRGISLVPEERRLFSDMSVLENLQLGAYRCRGQNEIGKRLETVFDYFPRLEERKNLPAHSLSGGEQQMLAIGRALMSQPRLLILDEPSFGLSPVLVAQIKRIITKIRENTGMTILVAEQNARLALSLGEQCYVLESGRITLEGSTSELTQDERVKKAYLGME